MKMESLLIALSCCTDAGYRHGQGQVSANGQAVPDLALLPWPDAVCRSAATGAGPGVAGARPAVLTASNF